ncbi:ATP-binding cassette domain-containing protein [candidate division KSB3 bacterium]|jgi:branched-chain amino acid transport system ATP-binding protein|uniref:ATP-binding cassette domain-containing protein n=1 Tax=candidate division KSB3 bacterium TaxID=2044937 RepID=A0A9D5JUN3_9BACT|nr:ATP-binding cassette domain-containing protein [candidate division KSB3 bacterium]MBD3324572.1 ATP-binding cassette domain-containing protein [candidate division KSB3 bacterium]
MLLRIENLHVKYGNIEALHGIDIEVNEGEMITILGANGAGKSTTLLTISGLVKPSAGQILFNGTPLHSLKAHDIVKSGIAHIPEGRRLFGTLTVQENLNMGAFVSSDAQQVQNNQDWIYDLFPILKERREQLAGTLSGGEQQMLAIGRGLMSSPKILLLDEPSLGLAPLLVKTIFETLKQINEAGLTVVLVEQNARMALKIAHRGYVMEVGRIALHDSAGALLENPDVQNAYLGGI